MELIWLFLIAWQARWCMNAIDRRQPLARWGSVTGLGLSWVFSSVGEFWVSTVGTVVTWLIVMWALKAKREWLKKQQAGG